MSIFSSFNANLLQPENMNRVVLLLKMAGINWLMFCRESRYIKYLYT